MTIIPINVKMPFYMVTCKKRCIWSNHQGLLLRGSPGRCVECRLHKAIYGLKQSPKAWIGKFSGAMVRFGLHCCQSDLCVFFYLQERKVFVNSLYWWYQYYWWCYFLGNEIAWSIERISLSQIKYVLDILEETCVITQGKR